MRRKLNSMRFGWILILTLVMLAHSDVGCMDRFKTWESAMNSHSIENILALYASDAKIVFAGLAVFSGEVEIRGFLEWLCVMGTQLSLQDFGQNGDTLHCSAVETSEWNTAAGIGPQHYSSIRFLFGGGLIRYQRWVLSPESLRTVIDISHSVQEWATDNRSQQVSAMMGWGKFVYNKETAGTNLQLLREWRKVTKNQ